MNVAAIPRSRLKIRVVTESLREIFGMSKKVYFPIVEFIEFVLGDPENDFNYEIVEPHEMENVYGTTNTATNTMRIRRDVYERAVKGNPRDRFTLCHELGHYFLHRPACISYARGEVPAYRSPEWQANTFAAELLAPYHLVEHMSIEEMVEQCGISRQAAEIQHKEIHK